MKFRLIFSAVVIFILAMNTAPAKISFDVSHSLSPDKIWYLDPESMPGTSHATISVTGESVLEDASVEVVLAIDSSGSMDDSDPENKRLVAAKIFVGIMNASRDKVGVVSWDDDINFFVAPTNNFLYVNNSIDRVDSSGGTDMDEGLRKSIDLLSSGRHDARLIVLLSDGNSDYTPSGRWGSQADRARDEGIAIYTIGLNLEDSEAEEKLKNAAETTGGRYYSAPDIDILRSIYEDIGKEVVNLAGKNVKVRCAIPPEIVLKNYTVKPSSDSFEGDFRIITWNVETITINETWTTSFDIITKKVEDADDEGEESDIFGSELDISRVQDGKSLANVTFRNRSLRSMGMASAASMNVNLSADFNVIRERVGAIYDLIEEDDASRIVWRFVETTGDWAFLFEDGRLIIASTADFGLSTRDLLTGELLLSANQLNAVGANVAPHNGTAYGLAMYNVTGAKLVDDVVYYAEHAGIYQRITYEFSEDFDLNLVIPDCPIRESRLIVEGKEYDEFGGAAVQKYYLDGAYIAGCEFHDFPWTGSCTVDETEITDEISPGTHRFSSSDIAEPHTLTLEVVTASPPSKKFFLYSDDLTSVWVPAVTNRPI